MLLWKRRHQRRTPRPHAYAFPCLTCRVILNASPCAADQIEHFLANGYVKLTECFTRARAAEWSKELWIRLGMDLDDSTTWTTERTNMPVLQHFDVAEISPKARALSVLPFDAS